MAAPSKSFPPQRRSAQMVDPKIREMAEDVDMMKKLRLLGFISAKEYKDFRNYFMSDDSLSHRFNL